MQREETRVLTDLWGRACDTTVQLIHIWLHTQVKKRSSHGSIALSILCESAVAVETYRERRDGAQGGLRCMMISDRISFVVRFPLSDHHFQNGSMTTQMASAPRAGMCVRPLGSSRLRLSLGIMIQMWESDGSKRAHLGEYAGHRGERADRRHRRHAGLDHLWTAESPRSWARIASLSEVIRATLFEDSPHGGRSWLRIASQSEVIRAMLFEDSPRGGLDHLDRRGPPGRRAGLRGAGGRD